MKYIEEVADKIREIKDSGVEYTEQMRLIDGILNTATEKLSKELSIDKKTIKLAIDELVSLPEKPLEIEKEIKRCMAGVRLVAPKLHGLEIREQDNLAAMSRALSIANEMVGKLNQALEEIKIANQQSSDALKITREFDLKLNGKSKYVKSLIESVDEGFAKITLWFLIKKFFKGMFK